MSELPLQTLAPALLLHRLSDELLQCRAMVSRIEKAAHQAFGGDDATERQRHWHVNLQQIDLLDQNLDGLAACLSRIAAQPALRDAADISEARVLGPLKLDDLRRRLLGHPENRTGSHKIELF